MLPTIERLYSVVKEELPSFNLALDRVVFVSVQHLLYTTLDIFKALIQLGAKTDNLFLLGKHYSNCPDVINKAKFMGIQHQKNTPLEFIGTYQEVMQQDIANMWKHVLLHLQKNKHIDTVVVLDDGGRALKSIPEFVTENYHVVGAEQTTEGIRQLASCNFYHAYIDIATSAAKSLEANMVTNAIINKIADKLPAPRTRHTCGVVGVGFIGSAVAARLVSLGYDVLLYDSNCKINTQISNVAAVNGENQKINDNSTLTVRKTLPENCTSIINHLNMNKESHTGNLNWVSSLGELIRGSDYIFGCTGRDFISALDDDIADTFKGNKYLISCSSEDKEFYSLLKNIQQSEHNRWSPLGDIHWQMNKDSYIHLIKGGFPCNFDQSGTSVPASEIQLTRALNFGAIIQALAILPSYRRNAIRNKIMLDPAMQKFIVLTWFESKGIEINFKKKRKISFEEIKNFRDIPWIIRNSGGLLHKVPIFTGVFNNALKAHKYNLDFEETSML